MKLRAVNADRRVMYAIVAVQVVDLSTLLGIRILGSLLRVSTGSLDGSCAAQHCCMKTSVYIPASDCQRHGAAGVAKVRRVPSPSRLLFPGAAFAKVGDIAIGQAKLQAFIL